MSRTTFENALRAWVLAASGYSDQYVYWRDGDGPRAPGPSIVLWLGPLRQVGQDWVEVAEPEDPEDDATVTARGCRMTDLHLEAYKGDPTGDASPDGVLATVMAKAALPSIRAALIAGGVGIASFEPVQTINGMTGPTSFEARAMLTVHLHLMSEVSELQSYIETVRFQQVDDEGDPLSPEVEVTS
jgi:hypothetical protein